MQKFRLTFILGMYLKVNFVEAIQIKYQHLFDSIFTKNQHPENMISIKICKQGIRVRNSPDCTILVSGIHISITVTKRICEMS